jgi:hypothetical protein
VREVRSVPVTVTLDDLARATAKLRHHPGETGAWLEVAALMHGLGHTDDAELAFATIGEAARSGGQVALAVACARHLAELGSVRGPELVEQIIETYATGGPHFAATPPRVELPGFGDAGEGPVGVRQEDELDIELNELA